MNYKARPHTPDELQSFGSQYRNIKLPGGIEKKITLYNFEVFDADPQKIAVWKERIELIFSENHIPFLKTDRYGDTGAWCTHLRTGGCEIGVGSFWFDKTNAVPVFAILHELGHWYDQTTHFSTAREYFRTLGTLEFETRAWEYAVDFGVMIGFDMWEKAKDFSLACLGTYFTDPWGNVETRDFMNDFRGTPPTWEQSVARIEKKFSMA